jgi:hypothetical protein
MPNTQAISKEQVFDALADNQWHRYSKLIRELEVCKETVRSRVGELLDDGWCVISGPRGIKLIDKDDMNEETAQEVLAMVPWIVGLVSAMAARAIPIKRIMPEVRKCLPKTPEERKYLRSMMVRITHLIDWQEYEEPDGN